jgi:hypothetical protein
MQKTTIIIYLIVIITFQFSIADQVNSPEFQIAYNSKDDLDDDREDYIEDSLEQVKDMREDSNDKADDVTDKIQDSIQEFNVGPEGRRLRLSFINYFALRNHHLLVLPEVSIVDRIALFEFGFNGISFLQSDNKTERKFICISPVAGFLPVLSRPVRVSFGAGMAFQFETTDHMSINLASFLYSTGTVFFVKRVSSSITTRFLHSIKGEYCYRGSDYYPKKKGTSWIDIGLSVDAYF